jgi:hypothetical protein
MARSKTYFEPSLPLDYLVPHSSRWCRRRAWILVGAIWLAVSLAARAQTYLVTDLGTNLLPYAINGNGDVVGRAVRTNVGHAFFFTNGVATVCKSNQSTANSINNLGQSVGYFQDLSAAVHSWISTDSATLSDLGVGLGDTFLIMPATSPRWFGAAGINDAGQIVGTRIHGTYQGYSIYRGYVIANGATNDLPTLGLNPTTDFSLGGAISQNGTVAYMAGTNLNIISPLRACLYSNGVQSVLPTPLTTSAWVSSVNDSNQVVGYLETTTNFSPVYQQVFFWDGNNLTNIGGWVTNILAGSVYGLNNYGQVVGVTLDNNRSPPALVSFLYDETNGIADLNTLLAPGSGWVLSSPTAINDAGQITGFGYTNGVLHGYLLTPGLIFNPSSFKYNKNTGIVTLSISGLNGQTVILQAACGLSGWVSIATNTISMNKTTFTDNGTCPGGMGRYYRALVIQ